MAADNNLRASVKDGKIPYRLPRTTSTHEIIAPNKMQVLSVSGSSRYLNPRQRAKEAMEEKKGEFNKSLHSMTMNTNAKQ